MLKPCDIIPTGLAKTKEQKGLESIGISRTDPSILNKVVQGDASWVSLPPAITP
jgi:hypothetical protein